jgi:hypothetical protein
LLIAGASRWDDMLYLRLVSVRNECCALLCGGSARGARDRSGELAIVDWHFAVACEDRDLALAGIPDVGHDRLGSRLACLGVRVL